MSSDKPKAPAESDPISTPDLPGLKKFPTQPNGKTTGAYRIKDHTGKVVHATDDPVEAVHIFRNHAVTAPSPDGDETLCWKILPVDPRTAADPQYQAEQRRKEKKDTKQTVESFV